MIEKMQSAIKDLEEKNRLLLEQNKSDDCKLWLSIGLFTCMWWVYLCDNSVSLEYVFRLLHTVTHVHFSPQQTFVEVGMERQRGLKSGVTPESECNQIPRRFVTVS